MTAIDCIRGRINNPIFGAIMLDHLQLRDLERMEDLFHLSIAGDDFSARRDNLFK